MTFEFSKLRLPEIANKLAGEAYERFKKDIVALLVSQRIQVFQDQRSPRGPWDALKPSTLRRRQGAVDQYGSGRAQELAEKGMGGVLILQDRGVLRSSFTGVAVGPGGSEGAAQHIEETVGDEVAIATPVEYARAQNDGATISNPGTKNGFGRGVEIPAHAVTIPARPYDQFSGANIEELAELSEGYLSG